MNQHRRSDAQQKSATCGVQAGSASNRTPSPTKRKRGSAAVRANLTRTPGSIVYARIHKKCACDSGHTPRANLPATGHGRAFPPRSEREGGGR